MRVIIIIFVVSVLAVCMRMRTFAGAIIQTAAHLHSQFFHILVEFFQFRFIAFLVAQFAFLHQYLFRAPHLQRALFDLYVQIQFHFAPAYVVRIFAANASQRRLALIEIAVLQQILSFGFGACDHCVFVVGITARIAHRIREILPQIRFDEFTLTLATRFLVHRNGQAIVGTRFGSA